MVFLPPIVPVLLLRSLWCKKAKNAEGALGLAAPFNLAWSLSLVHWLLVDPH